jgi:hypothetical protein
MNNIFTTPRVLPGVYEAELNRKFSSDWLTWEPETLWSEIRRIYGFQPVASVANKINALRVLITKPELFFKDATVFENMVLAACDLNVDPVSFQLASPEEVVFGIEAFTPIALNHKVSQPFGPEIVAYIRAVCQNDGLLVYPATLKFAQPAYMDELRRIAEKIVPRETPPTDETDIPGVQGFKLYQIIQCVKAMHGPSEVS